METVLVEVYGDDSPKGGERFLIEYPAEMYSSLDVLREEIQAKLEQYMRTKNIKAMVRFVALQSNGVIGHFFESEFCPQGVKRQRTLTFSVSY